MGVTLIQAITIAILLQFMTIILVAGQNELFSNPSQIPKTHFQCKGRPAGYYADIEAGCQVYHMCDGLGRQFSYTCPNTTLFQQRMLICDHWYMVNCSKAESDYGANLLIGQRDKPFVSDDEHDVRTPRPDLFDRPYGSDFASEAFRKTISPLLNSIQSFEKRPVHHKSASSPVANHNEKPFAVPSHWSTVHPLQTSPTPPPAPAPTQANFQQNSQSNFQPNFQHNSQQNFQQNFQQNSQPNFNRFEENQGSFTGGSDLRTSSSQDSRRTQNENVFETDEKPSTKKTTPKPLIIEFQPPFEQPIYNTNKAPATTNSPQFTRPSPTTTVAAPSQTTVNLVSPTNKPTSSDPSRSNLLASAGVVNFGDRLNRVSAGTTTTPASATQNRNLVPVLADGEKPKEPQTVLLPPYENVKFGGATTQGPPVYREWKLPASDLEPPFDERKSNGVITISTDDNQIPVIPPQTTQASAGSSLLGNDLVPPLFEPSSTNIDNVKLPALSLQPPAYSPLPVYNDTVQSASNHSFPSFSPLQNANGFTQSVEKSQTQRSVPNTATANSLTSRRQSETTTRKDLNYLDLKKQFSIPEYTFPLENIERPSYTESNAVNSFQIKIPDDVAQSQELISEGSSNEVQRRPWYGENAKCPECHPSFLKPGTCEPCIKLR